MKTNPCTSKSVKRRLLLAWLAWLLLVSLIALASCKSPAILTNADDHHSRDSNYHANHERIETHDTIIIGIPTPSLCSEAQGGSVLYRISDRTRTIRDTTYVLKTDTLLRTQTITKTEKHIPPFYNICTIAFITFIAFVTLRFSIRLLFRYLKIRSPT